MDELKSRQSDRCIEDRLRDDSFGSANTLRYTEQERDLEAERKFEETKDNQQNTRAAVETTDSAVEAINTKVQKTAFFSTVEELYTKDRTRLRRLSQSNVSPCSQEYKAALNDVYLENSDESETAVKKEKKPGKRKVSWNTKRKISQHTRSSGSICTLDDGSTGKYSRPRGLTLPKQTFPSSFSTRGLNPQDNRAVSKSAWMAAEQANPSKPALGRQRHISLPCPPANFRTYGTEYEPVATLERKSKSLTQVNRSLDASRKLSFPSRGKKPGLDADVARNGTARSETSFRRCSGGGSRETVSKLDFRKNSRSNSDYSTMESNSSVASSANNSSSFSGETLAKAAPSNSSDRIGGKCQSRGTVAWGETATAVETKRSRKFGHVGIMSRGKTPLPRAKNERPAQPAESRCEKSLGEMFEEIKDCRYLRRKPSTEARKKESWAHAAYVNRSIQMPYRTKHRFSRLPWAKWISTKGNWTTQ